MHRMSRSRYITVRAWRLTLTFFGIAVDTNTLSTWSRRIMYARARAQTEEIVYPQDRPRRRRVTFLNVPQHPLLLGDLKIPLNISLALLIYRARAKCRAIIIRSSSGHRAIRSACFALISRIPSRSNRCPFRGDVSGERLESDCLFDRSFSGTGRKSPERYYLPLRRRPPWNRLRSLMGH